MASAATANPRWSLPRRPMDRGVEWNAGRFADPVERLGYLRRSAAFWSQRPIRRVFADSRLRQLSVLVAAAMLLPVPMVTDAAALHTVNASAKAKANLPEPAPGIWQVETTANHELYSNGLRVEKSFTAPAEGARKFQRWRMASGVREESPTPFGIVFHTTESDAQSYD